MRFNISLSTLLEKIVALTLMVEFDINSIFDVYYAATTLLRDPDRIIISTDKIYDKIPGIKRIDPRKLRF